MPHRALPVSRARLVLVAALAALSACSARPRQVEDGRAVGRVVTAAEIAETGATNAWDALRFTVKTHYFQEYRGEPVTIRSRRGQSSLVNVEELNNTVDSFTGTIAVVVTPITMLSLLVGGIVVMNIMLVTVTERTFEIGLRKALENDELSLHF